jgi:hypothetical protein
MVIEPRLEAQPVLKHYGRIRQGRPVERPRVEGVRVHARRHRRVQLDPAAAHVLHQIAEDTERGHNRELALRPARRCGRLAGGERNCQDQHDAEDAQTYHGRHLAQRKP